MRFSDKDVRNRYDLSESTENDLNKNQIWVN